MNLYNEKVTEIRETNNYDIFKNMLGNRELKDKNYKKLMRSINEKQLIIPILVNEKFEIIDGQHRFSACKSLGKPVYYYIIPGYEIEDVKRANLVSCNWGLDDYLNLHYRLNKKEYINFKEIQKKNKLRVSQLLEIVAVLEGKEYGRAKIAFEDGTIKIESPLEVQRFLMDLSDFKQLKEYSSPKFTKAFLKLYKYDNYKHEHMKRKLRTLSHRLKKQLTYNEYISMLVNDIYAFGSSNAGFKYDANANRFYEI